MLSLNWSNPIVSFSWGDFKHYVMFWTPFTEVVCSPSLALVNAQILGCRKVFGPATFNALHKVHSLLWLHDSQGNVSRSLIHHSHYTYTSFVCVNPSSVCHQTFAKNSRSEPCSWWHSSRLLAHKTFRANEISSCFQNILCCLNLLKHSAQHMCRGMSKVLVQSSDIVHGWLANLFSQLSVLLNGINISMWLFHALAFVMSFRLFRTLVLCRDLYIRWDGINVRHLLICRVVMSGMDIVTSWLTLEKFSKFPGKTIRIVFSHSTTLLSSRCVSFYGNMLMTAIAWLMQLISQLLLGCSKACWFLGWSGLSMLVRKNKTIHALIYIRIKADFLQALESTCGPCPTQPWMLQGCMSVMSFLFLKRNWTHGQNGVMVEASVLNQLVLVLLRLCHVELLKWRPKTTHGSHHDFIWLLLPKSIQKTSSVSRQMKIPSGLQWKDLGVDMRILGVVFGGSTLTYKNLPHHSGLWGLCQSTTNLEHLLQSLTFKLCVLFHLVKNMSMKTLHNSNLLIFNSAITACVNRTDCIPGWWCIQCILGSQHLLQQCWDSIRDCVTYMRFSVFRNEDHVRFLVKALAHIFSKVKLMFSTRPNWKWFPFTVWPFHHLGFVIHHEAQTF